MHKCFLGHAEAVKSVVEEILWHTLGDDANRTAQKETICACTTLSRDEVIHEIKEKRLAACQRSDECT